MLAPGIQYVQVPTPKVDNDALRADVAAFAGIFARGPVLVARRIEDWGEQRTTFGGFVTIPGPGRKQALGPLGLYGFFQNQGGTAIVFRLASPKMRASAATAIDPYTGLLVGLAASSPGAWGDDVRLAFPLRITRTASLAAGFPIAPPTKLAAGDVVRVVDKNGALAF